jgi:hypothetical protein
MGEVFLGIVIVFVVVTVSVILFGGWVIIKVIRGAGSLLGVGNQRPVQGPPPRRGVVAGQVIQCQIRGCRHVNPGGARFCRHCGHALGQVQYMAA